MKKYFSKILLTIITLLGILYTDDFFLATETEWLNDYQNLSSLDSIHILDSSGKENGELVELPGEYGTYFRIGENTEYTVIGGEKTGPAPGTTSTYVYRFDPYYNGEQSILIKDVANYNGKRLDLKVTIDGYNISKGTDSSGQKKYVHFIAVTPEDAKKTIHKDFVYISPSAKMQDLFLFMGSTADNSLMWPEFHIGDSFTYTYHFLDENSVEIPFKGVWNYNNINENKALALEKPQPDFSTFYVREGTKIKYRDNVKNDLVNPNYFQLLGNGADLGTDETKISQLIEGKTSHSMTMIKKDSLYDETYPNSMNAMAIFYDTQSIMRIAPPVPIYNGLRNSAKHDDPDYLKVFAELIQTVPSNAPNLRNKSFRLKVQCPIDYTIDLSSVKIIDLNTGENLDNFFSKNTSWEGRVLNLVANNPTSDEFNGRTYKIYYEAIPDDKENFSFQKHSYQKIGEDMGYMTSFSGAGAPTVYWTFGEQSEKLLAGIIKASSSTLYNGKPIAEPLEGLTIPYGKTILEAYPEGASEMLPSNFTQLVDTDSDADRPVTAKFGATLPDTSDTTVYVPGKEVEVPIILTTSQGVTKEVIAKLKISESSATLKVNFVDEDSQPLSTIVIDDFKVGDSVDLDKITKITDELAKYTSDGGYTVVESPEPQFIMDTADKTVTYKLRGNLYIASAPELFDFGSVTYKAQDIEVKEAKNLSTEKPLTIVDNRSSKTKWTLTVKAAKEFTSGTETIPGAMRYRVNKDESITLDSNDQPAYVNPTGGNTTVSEGWSEEGAGLGIFIESNQIAKTGTYDSEIIWTLSATP